MRPSTIRFALPVIGLAVAAALAGCEANPIRDAAVAVGVTGGEPRPAPDFVSRTRGTDPDFVPVGTSAPKREIRAKTRAEIGTAEAELERIRAANEARGAASRVTP